MFIDASTYTRNGKTYRRVLLRNSYRLNGNVRHDTLANLSACSDEEVQAIKLALKNKANLSKLGNVKNDIHTQQGLGVGAVWVLQQLADQLGLTQALGNTRVGKLSLWLVMATIIEQGSRLSATRLAQRHHVCDILGLEGFNENDLYTALDELAHRQEDIEDQLFHGYYGDKKPHFYLYAVTSSYFEGEQNELSAYGYNRDKKKGKKQIVIGLMTDDDGRPIAIEVFEGNTPDQRTVEQQIKKMAERFKVTKVTLIGDRGMLKQAQIEDLHAQGFNYITAITKPQIESLVKKNIMSPELFSDKIMEITHENIRYVLHRNPIRAKEIAINRQEKLNSLELMISKKNQYLNEHSRAKTDVALSEVTKKASQLKLNSWISINVNERTIFFEINQEEKNKVAQWDGCYAIKTDITTQDISTEKIHSRYKNLASVEKAFRTMKTTLLEMRSIYVRKENRTRAHVFVVMLAYLLVHHLQQRWYDVEATVEEGIAELASISSLSMSLPGVATWQTIPSPRPLGLALLNKLGIILPITIPSTNALVVTTKKLIKERK